MGVLPSCSGLGLLFSRDRARNLFIAVALFSRYRAGNCFIAGSNPTSAGFFTSLITASLNKLHFSYRKMDGCMDGCMDAWIDR